MPRRGPVAPTVLIVALAAVMVCVVASPILLAFVAMYDPRPSTWEALADVGQAYGGAAALVSALALGGIAGSLFLQWRQNKLTQLLVFRERHFELVKLGMDNPELIQAIGGKPERERALLISYASLWVGHWAAHWDLRVMEEGPLRFILQDFFQDERVRHWWLEYGPNWSTDTSGRRRKFIDIVTQECVAVGQRHSDSRFYTESKSPSLRPSTKDSQAE